MRPCRWHRCLRASKAGLKAQGILDKDDPFGVKGRPRPLFWVQRERSSPMAGETVSEGAGLPQGLLTISAIDRMTDRLMYDARRACGAGLRLMVQRGTEGHNGRGDGFAAV